MVIPPLSPFSLLNTSSLALAALPAVSQTQNLPQALPVPAVLGGQWNLTAAQVLQADLAQAEQPIPMTDTTLLQAEIDAGTALAPFGLAGLVAPTAPGRPRPGGPSFQAGMTELNAELAASVTPSPGLLAEAISLSPSTLQLVPSGQASPGKVIESMAQAEAALAVAGVLQAQDRGPSPVAAAPLLQAELAVYQPANIPEAASLAADAAAQTALSVVYQQALLTVLQAGVAKVSLQLAGPPPGLTETLASSGWVQLPASTKGIDADATWSFTLPFPAMAIQAVTSTPQANPAGVKDKPDEPGEVPTAYGSHGEQEPAPGESPASTLDILD